MPDPPVVLFLPARDEEASVGGVVRRVPPTVLGRRVVCIVVDDGSVDATAAEAAAAGAQVVRLGGRFGLGAAVRRGLAEAVRLGAAAVAFCDADGEYSPEEVELLVAPILSGGANGSGGAKAGGTPEAGGTRGAGANGSGGADYVVGSRFSGRIGTMRPWRRVGNRTLTLALRLLARAPITDGQSGYRALSPRAAASAEIVHDYNYAQVLTLDLLAKGFGYAEVPISYSFRTTGRSFVRLLPYLRRVVPAVVRELRSSRVAEPPPAPEPAADSGSVLHDVG